MTKESFGFLTIVDHARNGIFGGYLVVNGAGRPLEFHCTAPIRPSRAQEILYGTSLKPYLYGEQVGRTLLEKAKQRPQVVCTDQRPALAVRPFVEMPVALVIGSQNHEEEGHNGDGFHTPPVQPDNIREYLATIPTRSDEQAPYSADNRSEVGLMEPAHGTEIKAGGDTSWRIHAAKDGSSALTAFLLGHIGMAVLEDQSRDRPLVIERLSGMAEMLDLEEPFQRIRDAITEARRGG